MGSLPISDFILPTQLNKVAEKRKEKRFERFEDRREGVI